MLFLLLCYNITENGWLDFSGVILIPWAKMSSFIWPYYLTKMQRQLTAQTFFSNHQLKALSNSNYRQMTNIIHNIKYMNMNLIATCPIMTISWAK